VRALKVLLAQHVGGPAQLAGDQVEGEQVEHAVEARGVIEARR
jgi:hypothetical protein